MKMERRAKARQAMAGIADDLRARQRTLVRSPIAIGIHGRGDPAFAERIAVDRRQALDPEAAPRVSRFGMPTSLGTAVQIDDRRRPRRPAAPALILRWEHSFTRPAAAREFSARLREGASEM